MVTLTWFGARVCERGRKLQAGTPLAKPSVRRMLMLEANLLFLSFIPCDPQLNGFLTTERQRIHGKIEPGHG